MMKLVLVFLACLAVAESNLLYYPEGESGVLKCNGKGDVQFWFLHGKGIAIRHDVTATTIEDIQMQNNGTLSFRSVSKEYHEGNHVCVTKLDGAFKAYSVTMNVRPLPPSDLWNTQYQGMFLTGLIAALICLILVVGSCLVYRHRYIVPLVRVRDSSVLVRETYDNPVMNDDDYGSAKM